MGLVYGSTLYHGSTIKHAAECYVRAILRAYKATGAKTLVSRGSSGCAIASIALMDERLEHFGHIHCGKTTGHQGRFSGRYNDIEQGVIFVDDFIETGHTFRTVRQHLAEKDFGKIRTKIVAMVVADSCDTKYTPRNVQIFYVNI